MRGGRQFESRLVQKHKQKLRGPLLLLTRGMTYVTACFFFFCFFFRRQSEKNPPPLQLRQILWPFAQRGQSGQDASRGLRPDDNQPTGPRMHFQNFFFLFLFLAGTRQINVKSLRTSRRQSKKNVPALGAFSPPII